ncbi:MAG: TRCF domain-containing protein, partial [Pseudomonadota bacterium]|nr:TRCF domain-containing protein [Pseudomonadota bacterium]
FYQRKFNILFCTSIIESGLDVPTANTIIINRADQFGLAQLHQLRGRVGRSHHKAFALLLTPPKQSMTEDARKRLSVIESMEQLGAGFVLATHDLEIRGAGELLGEKQTGQIQQIGFSLYMDMLNQAVESIRLGKSLDIEKTMALGPEVNMNLPALLPEEYLPDIQMRLVLYKRIASAKDKPALNALKVELIDRFGLLPEATHTLFMQTEIRLKAEKIGIKKLEVYQHGITLEFSKNSQISPEAIVLMIQDQQGYKLDTKQRLHLNLELISSEERFQGAKKLLGDLERNSSMMQSRNLASD